QPATARSEVKLRAEFLFVEMICVRQFVCLKNSSHHFRIFRQLVHLDYQLLAFKFRSVGKCHESWVIGELDFELADHRFSYQEFHPPHGCTGLHRQMEIALADGQLTHGRSSLLLLVALDDMIDTDMSPRLFGMKFAPVCWSWIILSKWQERSHGQRGSELRRTRFDRLQVFRPPRSFAGPSARGWLRSRQGRQPSPPL